MSSTSKPLQKDKSSNIIIREATAEDIPSLATIVARSFHPVNPYMAHAIPDTPLVRTWWSDTFTSFLEQPGAHTLIASPASSSPSPPEQSLERTKESHVESALGVLILRRMTATETGSGLWTKHAWTPDHDHDDMGAMIGAMVTAREKLMLGREHFSLELFGVDNDYKGLGLGKLLLVRACEIADEAGLNTFVQANASATPFYAKLGFAVQDKKVLPGEAAYTESMMVRPYVGKKVQLLPEESV